MDPPCPVADGQADEGHADRPGDDAQLVLRARRPAASRHLPAARAGDPQGGARPRGGRHPDHPDRRGRAARRPAAAAPGVAGGHRLCGDELARRRARRARGDAGLQLALAIRKEVLDLEAAGIRIIQIDEAALREGLPLRRPEWRAYLDWAGTSFRIAANGVRDETQVHTHMCYSEFNDIIE